MTKMKKILWLLLIQIICLVLSACNNAESTANNDIIDINNGNFDEIPYVDEEEFINPDKEPDKTVGQSLVEEFEIILNENSELTAQEIMDVLIQNPVIEFMGKTETVQEGYLSGFGDNKVTGFVEGVVLAPDIITIPFVAYVFVLDIDSDVDLFKEQLLQKADVEWNMVDKAEELVVESVGRTVFFVMSPKFFES